MPKSCANCRFNGAYCYAKGDEDVHSTLSCPLIPIPKHGRLIDEDTFKDSLSDLLRFPSNLVNGQWIVNTILEQPTVIPAEEGE